MADNKIRGGPTNEANAPETPKYSKSESDKLQESTRLLEKQRNDLKTIYYIADQLSRSIQPKLLSRRVVELTSSVFGSVCVLIAGHFNPETQAFHGTVTYPEADGNIVERPFPDEGAKKVPFYNSVIVGRWMRGELDGVIRFRVYPTVAYPLERHGRRLGLILAPAADRQASQESGRSRMNPEIVQAARQHLAVALELSELQREQLHQERLAAIGQTVASLAHYLKNVLNGLKGGEYVIERALKNDNPEKIPKGLAVLRGSIRHIERLTYDMLYYAGDRGLDRNPVNPNEIMQEVLESTEEIADGKGIKITARLDERMIPIPLDRHAIYRAVLNLVTNAIEACLESERGDTVTLKTSMKAGDAILTVEDNGVGISPSALSRVTERFYTTKPSSGTGLGLTVTKKIAEQHGGALEIDSVLGHGSAFHIRIPKS
ncbi:MAG: HAMP domain-containing histidine kinase [Acidobacteria bacterium]|nr:HAMP domain-containing histidine kinase [Acidobacteriota bacterium]